MIHIIICEDEITELSFLEALVREWAAERKHEIEITLCRNAEQFLFRWEEKKEADIMLLDTDMPGMNGISLARRLREEGEPVQIIFVTGLADYVLEGYDVEAVSYLIKPVGRKKILSVWIRQRSGVGRRNPSLCWSCREVWRGSGFQRSVIWRVMPMTRRYIVFALQE